MKTFMILISFLSFLNAAKPIVLHYHERVPYQITTSSDNVEGLVATPVTEAFKKAKIPFKWHKTPAKRQIQRIKYNVSRECAIGWFKNAQREKFAKYTNSIYQDKPTVALVLKSNKSIKDKEKLAEALSNQEVKLVVKDSYSYGAFIDKYIQEYKSKLIMVSGENLNMIKMIYLKRADMMFVSKEEAKSLILNSGYKPNDFKLIHFKDMPYGNKRYIMCSQQVEDDVIYKLNNALNIMEK